jgi:hypothetical protein
VDTAGRIWEGDSVQLAAKEVRLTPPSIREKGAYRFRYRSWKSRYWRLRPFVDSLMLKWSSDRTQGQEPDDTGRGTGTQNPQIKLVEDSALPFWISSLVLPRLGLIDVSTAYRLLPRTNADSFSSPAKPGNWDRSENTLRSDTSASFSFRLRFLEFGVLRTFFYLLQKIIAVADDCRVRGHDWGWISSSFRAQERRCTASTRRRERAVVRVWETS